MPRSNPLNENEFGDTVNEIGLVVANGGPVVGGYFAIPVYIREFHVAGAAVGEMWIPIQVGLTLENTQLLVTEETT